MYGVEVFDGETARFEVELSEDDVHGQWKLNGEVLSPSAVRLIEISVSTYLVVRSTFIWTPVRPSQTRLVFRHFKVERIRPSLA